jgi:hypothetical protein
MIGGSPEQPPLTPSVRQFANFFAIFLEKVPGNLCLHNSVYDWLSLVFWVKKVRFSHCGKPSVLGVIFVDNIEFSTLSTGFSTAPEV